MALAITELVSTNAAHPLGDGAKGLLGLLGQTNPLLRLAADGGHGADRGAGAGLQLLDHLLDLDRGPLGAVGQ